MDMKEDCLKKTELSELVDVEVSVDELFKHLILLWERAKELRDTVMYGKPQPVCVTESVNRDEGKHRLVKLKDNIKLDCEETSRKVFDILNEIDELVK